MPTPSACPACQSREAKLVETVSVDALASAWASENCHGNGVGYEHIHRFLLEDLGSEHVEFWQCHQCEIEFAQPMRSWSASHYPIEQHSLGFDHQVVLSDLATMAPVRVLDVGCADGQFLERGAALGHEMIGIDFAADDIETARTRDLDARVADVNEIAKLFEGQSRFDVICLFQIIEHLNEPDQIFSQLNEIAAPDCTLIVGCPSPLRYTRQFPHKQRIGRSDYWDYPPQHTLRWNANALKIFQRRHGWQVESVVYEPFSIINAAAHLAGIDYLASARDMKARLTPGSVGVSPAVQRIKHFNLLLKMLGPRLFGKTTGIRLLTRARRSVDFNPIP